MIDKTKHTTFSIDPDAIEDLMDLLAWHEAKAEFDKNPVSYSHAEVMAEFYPITSANTASAPALSSGSLPEPHFGEMMHEGQPDSQPHDSIIS